MKNAEIKCIIFDVGGVLFADRIEPVYDSINRKIGMKLFVRTSRPHRNALLGRINEEEKYRMLSEKSGIPAKDLKNILTKEYVRILSINKDVIRLRDRLKKRGYTTGILSNMTGRSRRINAQRKVFAGFNPVVLSCNVKAIKPHAKIYKIFLKRSRFAPQACVFIDDREKNIMAARKIGMKTILFRNAVQLERDLKRIGVEL